VSIHRSYTEDRAFFNPVLEAMCLYTASILNNVPRATHMTHKKIRLRGDSPRDDVSVHRFDTEHRALRNVHDTKKWDLEVAVLEAMCLYTVSILNTMPCAMYVTHKKWDSEVADLEAKGRRQRALHFSPEITIWLAGETINCPGGAHIFPGGPARLPGGTANFSVASAWNLPGGA